MARRVTPVPQGYPTWDAWLAAHGVGPGGRYDLTSVAVAFVLRRLLRRFTDG
jgi:hypothetical protein